MNEIALALKQLNSLILGKEQIIKQAMACILAKGHLLLEDVPGVGKTTLAKGLAMVLGLDYRRVQFTNDMLPADLLGISIFEPQKGAFTFHPGPVFHRFLPITETFLLIALIIHLLGRPNKLTETFSHQKNPNDC